MRHSFSFYGLILVICLHLLSSCRTTQRSYQVASEVTNNSAEVVADSVSDSLQSFTSIEAEIHIDSADFSGRDSVPYVGTLPLLNLLGLTNIKGIDLKVKLEQNTSHNRVSTHSDATQENETESHNETKESKKKANYLWVWIIAFVFFLGIDLFIAYIIWRTKRN